MTGVLVAIGGTVQPEAVGGRGRLAPGVHAELGEDVAHVDAGGLAADVERLGDLAVRPAGGHQAQDLALPGREPGGAVAWDRAQTDVQPPAARERLDLGPQRRRAATSWAAAAAACASSRRPEASSASASRQRERACS